MRRAEADSVGLLLPWYLNGTLSAEDRQRVEEHLPSCEECRALLDTARELQGLGGDDVLGFLDHPEAQHLDDFAADPELLEPRLAGWIRDHVAQCSACGEVV
jgi:predicted anti-sigma-YlaC factor YlaD